MYRIADKLFSQSMERAGPVTEKRERILRGMLEAVGTKGYEQVTVQDALAKARLYRQVFYDLFEDKEDCYLQAVEAGTGWVELAMREAALGKIGWRAQLRGALRGLLGFLDEQPEIGRALFVEVHAAGHKAVERRTEAMERAVRMMDLARDESDGMAPAISAEAVVAGILAVLHSRLSSPRAGGFGLLLPELMYLAVLPYFGPEAAASEMDPEAG
jgi:AcrR family transcriptional regulator